MKGFKNIDGFYVPEEYEGCRNCKYQISPLRSCEWAESGGNVHVSMFCPRWENRDDSPNPCEVRSIHQEPTKIYVNGEEVELDVPIKRGTVDLNTLTYYPKDGDE